MPSQPSNSWSLQLINPDGSLNGAPATLASYGIDSARYHKKNMAAHTLEFTVGGRVLDAADLFPYGQLLALLDPGLNGAPATRRFFGRVDPWDRQADASKQDHHGIVVNPWWYFKANYQQRYNFPIFNLQAQITGYNNFYTPRVVLYFLYNGAPQNGQPATGFYQATTGQQLADAVNYAIGRGAPIKLGQVDPATTPFSSFQKGITMEEVIHHAFRFEPDFCVYWDYTTLPFPTIHFLKQKSLKPLLIDLTTPGVREKVHIKPRPDWQRSYVTINYDETETQGNQTYILLDTDFYPNPLAPPEGMSQTEFSFRGVDLFCDLSGEKVGIQQQQANFASLPFDITQLAIWRKWKPHIDPAIDATITNVVILQPTSTPPSNTIQTAPAIATQDEYDQNDNPVAYDETCIYEVVDGAWADWIPNSNGQRVRATAFAQVTHKAAPGLNPKTEIVPLSHDFTAVNINTAGESTNFTQKTSTTTAYAEAAPVGLAKAMWTSWQNLAIEGDFQNTEAVIGATQAISENMCLNFRSAIQPGWADVNAFIQSIEGDIEQGITNIQFGAPLILSGNELIEAMRATRYRITTVDLAYLFGGPLSTGSGTTRMSRKHHARHSQHGEAHRKIFQVSAAPDPSNPLTPDVAGVLTIDPTLTTAQTLAGYTGPSIAIQSSDILNASLANSGGA